MPTGYTAAVQDGTLTEFSEFAWECARAFGALVSLRDDPEADIPLVIEASSYHQDRLEDLNEELAELLTLTQEQIQARRDDAETERAVYVQSRLKEQELHRLRYQTMLAHVENWLPPTSDHTELKNFMIQQLEQSIDFDCGTSIYNDDPLPGPTQWLANQIQETSSNIAYHEKAYAEEVARAENRTKWLQDLRESLK